MFVKTSCNFQLFCVPSFHFFSHMGDNKTTINKTKRRSKLDRSTTRRSINAANDTPLDVIRGLPKSKWEEILQQEERDSAVLQVVEKIVSDSLQVAYERYLERQTVYFLVHCSHRAFIKLVRLYFVGRDRGEPDLARDPSWQPDEEPRPVPRDSWGPRSAPVVLADRPPPPPEPPRRPSSCSDDSADDTVPAGSQRFELARKVDVAELLHSLYPVGDASVHASTSTILDPASTAAREVLESVGTATETSAVTLSEWAKTGAEAVIIAPPSSPAALSCLSEGPRSRKSLSERLACIEGMKERLAARRLSAEDCATGPAEPSLSELLLKG